MTLPGLGECQTAALLATTRTFARRTDRFANFATGAKSAWHTSPFEDKKIKVFMAEERT